MLTIPDYKPEVGVIIPSNRSSYFKGYKDKYSFSPYTLVPRISFRWMIQDIKEFTSERRLELANLKAYELDIQVTEVLQMYEMDPLSMGIEFHENMMRSVEQLSHPNNIVSDFVEYKKLFHSLTCPDSVEEVTFSGNFIRNIMSRYGNIFVAIFDSDEYYKFQIIKNVINNEIFFILDNEEASRRSRLVNLKYEINISSDKWDPVMETLLVADIHNFREISRDYGMLIPPIFDDVKGEMSYFMRNFYKHSQEKISDFDIVYKSGVMVYFRSPSELRVNIERLSRRNTRNFFVVLTERVLSKSINKSLTTLETLLEAAPDILIGHGNKLSYNSFSPIELLSSFSPNPLDARFIKPYDSSQEFDEEEVEDIKCLLYLFESSNSIAKEVISRIDDILRYRAEMTEDVREFLRDYQNSSSTFKTHFSNLMINIFYAGMYMRQWRGPDHPFPKSGQETRYFFDNDSDEFYIGVTKYMTEAVKILKKMRCSSLNRLNMKTYSSYYFNYGFRLGDFITNVHNAEYCIRMASLPLISTSLYYSRMLGGDYLPNISLDGFDSIM